MDVDIQIFSKQINTWYGKKYLMGLMEPNPTPKTFDGTSSIAMQHTAIHVPLKFL